MEPVTLCDIAAPAAAPADERPYLLERVGEADIVQLSADGFLDLSVNDRILCWHLYQAAIAGRDIFYDQRYSHNLEMRDVIEAVEGPIAINQCVSERRDCSVLTSCNMQTIWQEGQRRMLDYFAATTLADLRPLARFVNTHPAAAV